MEPTRLQTPVRTGTEGRSWLCWQDALNRVSLTIKRRRRETGWGFGWFIKEAGAKCHLKLILLLYHPSFSLGLWKYLLGRGPLARGKPGMILICSILISAGNITQSWLTSQQIQLVWNPIFNQFHRKILSEELKLFHGNSWQGECLVDRDSYGYWLINHEHEKGPKRSGTYFPFLLKEEDTKARMGRWLDQALTLRCLPS